jgi:hypothetical protein
VTIRYQCYPKTERPPHFIEAVVNVFRTHEHAISTTARDKGLTSDEVLEILRADLAKIGFEVEQGKRNQDKILRPVLFGENGQPTLQYEVDDHVGHTQRLETSKAEVQCLLNPVMRCGFI